MLVVWAIWAHAMPWIDNQISLDDPIGKILPDLASPQVLEGFDASGEPKLRPAKRPITLRQLMTHTAGFVYNMWNGDMATYLEKAGIPAITRPIMTLADDPRRRAFDPATAGRIPLMIEAAQRLQADFPEADVRDLIAAYPNLEEVLWVQEEPRNMGAWHFIEPYLEWVLNQIHAPNKRPRYAGRAASAATATGLMSKHLAQLKALLDEALN